MRGSILVAALLLVGCASTSALTSIASAQQQDILSGNIFRVHCEQPPGSTGEAHCLGYLLGAVRTHALLAEQRLLKPIFCISPQKLGSQIKAVVVNYLRANPQNLHEDFGRLALVAADFSKRNCTLAPGIS